MPNFNNYYDDYYNPIDFGGATGVMAGIPNEARKDLFDFGSVPYQAMAASWTDLFNKRTAGEIEQRKLDEQNDLAQVFRDNPQTAPYSDDIARIYGKYGDIAGLSSIEQRRQQSADREAQALNRVLDLGKTDSALASRFYDLNGLSEKYGPLNTDSLGNQIVSTGKGGFAIVNPQTGATRTLLSGREDSGSGGKGRAIFMYNEDNEKRLVSGNDPIEYAASLSDAMDEGYTLRSPAMTAAARAERSQRELEAFRESRNKKAESPKEASDFESQSDPALLERLAQTFGYQQPTQKIVQVRKKLKVN